MASLKLGKVMVTPKGSYSPDILYSRLDLVEHKGSSYVAVTDVSGIEPSAESEQWQLVAEKGEDGLSGITVSGISPDESGNIPLTPLDIGAYSEDNPPPHPILTIDLNNWPEPTLDFNKFITEEEIIKIYRRSAYGNAVTDNTPSGEENKGEFSVIAIPLRVYPNDWHCYQIGIFADNKTFYRAIRNTGPVTEWERVIPSVIAVNGKTGEVNVDQLIRQSGYYFFGDKVPVDNVNKVTACWRISNDPNYTVEITYDIDNDDLYAYTRRAKTDGSDSSGEQISFYSEKHQPPYPVKTVNGKTGEVVLIADDISGAVTKVWGVQPDDNGDSKPNVGGRNFLLQTNQGTTRWVYSCKDGKGTLSEDTYCNKTGVKLTISERSTGWSVLEYNFKESNNLEPDTLYTISAIFVSDKDIKTLDVLCSTSQTTSVIAIPINGDYRVNADIIANTPVKRYFVLKTAKDFADMNYTNIRARFGSLQSIEAPLNLSVFDLKLEKGVVPTDWSPAPEDLLPDAVSIRLDEQDAALCELAAMISEMKGGE